MIKFFCKEDVYLILILILISVSIVLNAYFNNNGFLSQDSADYLSVAQNLINGNGYFISSERRQPSAVWPIGYPTLIAIVSYITNLSVFWASKLLNIVLIVSIFVILRRYYQQNTYLIALIFTWGSYITLFFYTWSETFFIFSLILFASSVFEFIKSDKPNFFHYTFILLATLFLFFSRYIGAFGFGIVGLLGLFYLIKKEFMISLRLILISITGISVMTYFLYTNYLFTGYPTGMMRIESPETNSELLIMLIKAFYYELVFPLNHGSKLIFLLQILIFIIAYKVHGLKINKCNMDYSYTLEKIFFLIGAIYLFFIIVMRWLSQFDEFSFRLLGPGTILIYIAFLGYLIKHQILDKNKWIKHYIIFFSILSLLINGCYKVIKNYNGITYDRNIEKISISLKDVKSNSVILFPTIHVIYLRLDLNLYTPYFKPYFKTQENWLDFLKRVDCKNKQLYIDTMYDGINNSGWFNQDVIRQFHSIPKNRQFINYECNY